MDFGVQRKSMTETKDTTDKTLRGGERKPLSLQRTVESGHVRQNFSHGRSKSVVVEKRKTRKLGGPGGAEAGVATRRAGRSRPRLHASRRSQLRRRLLPPTRSGASRPRSLQRGARCTHPRARRRALAQRRGAHRGTRPCRRGKPQLLLLRRRRRPSPRVLPRPKRLPLLRLAHLKRAHRRLHLRLRRRARRAPATSRPGDGGARPRTSYNPALQPREGGRPREIDIPTPAPRQAGSPMRPSALPARSSPRKMTTAAAPRVVRAVASLAPRALRHPSRTRSASASS